MNFEWKFAVLALNLMTWFQERVKILVAPFMELLNIFVLEHKACLKKLLKVHNTGRTAVLFKNFP